MRNATIADFLEKRVQNNIALTIYFTLIGLLSVLAGIAIWPVVFSLRGTGSVLAAVCGTLISWNWKLIIAYVVVSVLFVVFEKRSAFSALKIGAINLGIGSVANLILMLSQKGLLAGIGLSGTMASLLWFIISFMVSGIVSLVPVLVISVLAKLFHVVAFKLHDWRN